MKISTRLFSIVLAVMLMLTAVTSVLAAYRKDDVQQLVDKSAQYMLNAVKTPQVGSIGGEWAVIGLARSGYPVPQEYWDGYYATVEDYVRSCKGVLSDKKYTEYSRLTVALTAIGADPTDVAGFNLLTPLGDYENTIWQGINGPIWALIALDSGDYPMPVCPTAKVKATRQMYIDRILGCQLADGGWSLFGGTAAASAGDGVSDPDITGMALQALAKYQDQPAVKKATGEALKCMSEKQNETGGFKSWGTVNLESGIQMMVALCELGLKIDDPRFVKNGKTLLDDALSYYQPNGGFLHTQVAGSGSDQMSSEQGFYGLVAVLRSMQGKSSLYRMDDVTVRVRPGAGGGRTGLPGKHADVAKMPIIAPGTTFDDIVAHVNQPAIEAMAARGIINGKGNDRFDPDGLMTRAEFATIVVRALGLAPKKVTAFNDVPFSAWYADYVGTAYTYGIVNGKGNDRFDPEGKITREEAAVMVARAAKLCGMNTDMSNYQIINVLAQFGDYVTAGDWSVAGLAFCYKEDILDQNDLDIEPRRQVLRCEIAQMLYNLLGSAKLL